MNKIKAWFIAIRVFALPWMLVNTLFGVCMAGFSLEKWLLAFGISSAILMTAHLINSWRDFVKGLDRINGSKVKPYTAGSQVLPRGWLTLKEVQISAILMLSISTLLMSLAPIRLDTILLYLLGVAIALTYTDFFKPRGLGEIALFLGHGFGTTSLAYSLIKPLDFKGLAVGIMLGFWAGIVYTVDQWQDVETDFAHRVKNLAYIVFKANMKISQVWYFLVTGSIVMQLAFVLMGIMPPKTLITIFLLPLEHIAGIMLDYQFEKGAFLALTSMWLFPVVASIGLII